MAFCSRCGNQLEDGVRFCPQCGQPTDGSAAQQYASEAYQQSQPEPMKPESYMLFAILTTIFCCLPTGIYAIILASKVDGLFYAGRYAEAVDAAQGAKKWSIIGAVLAAIGMIGYIIFVCLLAAGGLLALDR